jgi:hypothetical protein
MNAIKIRLGLAWLVLVSAALAAAIGPGLVAFAQEDTEGPVITHPPTPGVDQLPGVMLLASTRAATEDGPVVSERPDNYRLYRYVPASATLQQVHFPDENRLGSASAALWSDSTTVLVNEGGPVGQKIVMVDFTGQTPPMQIGDTLPPISAFNPDAYVSVAWSPDGSQAWIGQTFPAGELVYSFVDGSIAPAAQVTVGSRAPEFSADGQTLVFTQREDNTNVAVLFIGPSDWSADPVKLTPDDVYENTPSWFPDGSAVAYAAAAADDYWEIRWYDFGSGTVQTVSQVPSTYIVTDLFVSPDGAWIGYSAYGPKSLSRLIQVVNVADPTIVVSVPHDASWSDRLLGWQPGS